jgi:O-acetylhomoserine/O-acetylserine sulfhydrylase-like pyridoxal-dependent enzyme
MAAYLLIRSMKTLHLRVHQQNESALRIARWLEAQPVVTTVNYPGLESHLHHDVAARQMRGYGGVLSFGLEGGFAAVKRRTAPPTSAPLRLSRGRRRPQATSNAPPRSALCWASPKA